MPESTLRRVAIVGLGYTGRSLGLGLRRALPALEVVGHDRDPDTAKEAQRAGAASKTHWNLLGACERADVIVLALPLAEVLAALGSLAPELAEGVVVTDTAALKGPVLAWTRSHLRSGVHYVGGHPLHRRGATPSADAFAGAQYCLTPVAETEPGAVSLVAGLVGKLGAKPIFLDPDEHDGIMMALQQAPALAAAAALRVAMAGEARADLLNLRTAVPPEATDLAARLDLAGVPLTLANVASLRLELDRLLTVLQALRAALDAEDAEGLARALAPLDEARRFWENGAPVSQPADDAAPPTVGSSWRRLFGLR